MSDELDGMTDAEMNELFAVEVVGAVRVVSPLQPRGDTKPRYWKIGGFVFQRPPLFCTDANAVLGRGSDWNVCFRDTAGKIFLTLWTVDGETCVAEAEGRCFSHACVKTIIRAKRAHP